LESPEALAPVSPAGFFRRHGVKLVLSILLGAGLALLLARGGLPLIPPKEAFAALKPWTVPVYVASLVGVHVFRAVRWRHLLRVVGDASLRSILGVSWVAFAVIMISPFRSGEVVRPYLISKRSSVTLWQAAGTIGAERVIDGLVLSLILFGALTLATPLDPLPARVGDLPVSPATIPGATYGVLALFALCFGLMGVFFWRRDLARRATHAVVGIVSRGLAVHAARIVEGVADGLKFLPSPRHLVPFLAETLVYWGLNALGVWLLGWGTGLVGMTFGQACVVMGVVGIGILVPAGPGYFGAFQLSTYMALAMYFPEGAIKSSGAAFVFLLYGTQLVFHVVAAILAGGLLLEPETPQTAQAP
jgi:hypothetical protein